MKNNKFSVLMSVYINENPINFEVALNSVFAQTLVPAEVILVEDGKLTDALYQVISNFKNKHAEIFKTHPLKKNVGLGNALRIGLLQCSHELVLRMDTDDICINNRFEKQISFMNDNPSIDLVGGWIAEFKTDMRKINGYRKVPETDKAIKKFHRKRNAINHMTVAFKKSKVIEAGSYEDLPYFEDYYLWAKMMQKGMLFYNFQESLIYARVGNDMIGRRHGWAYVKKEYHLIKQFKKIGFITNFEFIKMILTRFPIRMLPKPILSKVYNLYIR